MQYPRLFVWHRDVLTEWQDGIAFALAMSEDEARKLLADRLGCEVDSEAFRRTGLHKPPDEVIRVEDQTYAEYMWGSS